MKSYEIRENYTQVTKVKSVEEAVLKEVTFLKDIEEGISAGTWIIEIDFLKKDLVISDEKSTFKENPKDFKITSYTDVETEKDKYYFS